MTTKITKISDNREIGVLAAALYDDTFLLELSSFYKPGLFSDEKIDRFIEWAISHQEKHDVAPASHTWDILIKEIEAEHINEKEAPLYEKLLKRAESAHSKGLHIPFLLEEAKTLLKEKSLEQLVDIIDDHLGTGRHAEAIEAVETFSHPSTEINYIEPFKSMDLVKAALEKNVVPLFTFKGPLGELLNLYLTRDSFLALMGPTKRGKTWWMFEIAIRAIFARCNVAIFQAGDLTQDQGLLRFYKQISRSVSHEEHKVCGGMALIPIKDCTQNQDGSCTSINRRQKDTLLNADGDKPEWANRPRKYRTCTECENVGVEYAKDTWFVEQEIDRGVDIRDYKVIADRLLGRTLGRQFRMSSHVNGSISVTEISRIVKRWKREGWIPDVIVIDYADILAPEKISQKEFRHSENDKWRALRRLSQDYNCLVVTATQTDTKSYDVADLSLGNFSEARTKADHVTGMVGLNQTPEEKKAQVMRLGWLALREGEFNCARQVLCYQCLRLGTPYLGGVWVDRNKT